MDSNMKFMNKYMPEKIKKYRKEIQTTKQSLDALNQQQLIQWAQIWQRYYTQISTIGDNGNGKIISGIVILLEMAKYFKLNYDMKQIQRLIKQVYSQEKADKISNTEMIKHFKDVGYETKEYQVLVYEDPWYTKFYRMFSAD